MKKLKNIKYRKKVKIVEPTKHNKVSYYELFRYSTRLDKLFLGLGTTCAIICGVVHPYVMILFGDVTGIIVDYAASLHDNLTVKERKVLEDDLYEGVHKFGVYSSITGLTMIISNYLTGVFFTYSAVNQIFLMRQLILKKFLTMDMSWYEIRKTGDFATIFTDNFTKIEEGIGDKAGIFMIYETVFVTGIIMALAKAWKMAFVCLVPFPISSGIAVFISWLSSKFSKQELEAFEAAGIIAEEVLGAIRTVIAFGGEEKEFKRYVDHLSKAEKNNIKRNMLSGVSNGLMWFFIFASYALSFWYGVGLIIDDRSLPPEKRKYTPSNVVSVFFLILIATWNFGLAAPYFEIFGTACGAATKVFEILDTKPEISVFKNYGIIPKDIQGHIHFEDVYFHYPSRSNVMILQGFNLKIKNGETVALVGSSGSGKTTCIQLIQRFYDPISGSVTIDGIDVREFNLTWLRSNIGVVEQQPVLFATTIAENIRCGNLSASQEDIENAARVAHAHNFIRKLPRSYNTVIGEKGAQLSGGQKQKIAIARALIRKPKILLLDEATSALDASSEAEVQETLNAIRGECVTIIIAHRLSTVRNADRIVVIYEGKVIEKGSHKKLMKKKGAYYNLVLSHGIEDSDESSEDDLKSFDKLTNVSESSIAENSSEGDSLRDLRRRKCLIVSLLKMNKKEWLYILTGCLMAVLAGAALPVYGWIFGNIIGVLADPDDSYVRQRCNMLSLYFLIIGYVTAIATFLQIYAFAVAGERLTFKLRAQMFRAMLNQEMSWFDRSENGVGALCTKLSGEVASIQGAFGIRIGTVLNSLSTFFLASVISISLQWNLALVLISFLPIILLAVFFEQKFSSSQTDANQAFLENSANVAVEAIANYQTVASLGCERMFYDRYVAKIRPYLTNMRKQVHIRSIVMGVARSIMLFAYAVGMAYGAHLMVTTNLEYGTVFKVSEIVIAGSWSIGNAFTFTPNFQKGLDATERIMHLLDRVPEIRNVAEPLTFKEVKGDIDFENICFSYPNRPGGLVLNHLNLQIFRGKTVALVGSSGSGKSTLIQLLERFYDPLSGNVSLDSKDIKELDIANLRSHMGIVSQEPNLFGTTIAENIAYGANHRTVGMEEIIQAAKAANIHNFITLLPQGYETNLGNKGTQLSDGQKQRVAIARALIRNPQILLLDEATSSLDAKSEKTVQKALDDAQKNRTCIVVAHRIATIQDADLICTLQNGRIVEMGEHKELLERKGLYYKYHKLQTPKLM